MPRRRTGRVLVGVGLLVGAGALAACGGTGSSTPRPATPSPALVLRSGDTGWSYTLDSMTSCHLTDALTVLEVAGTRPVQVEQVGVQYSNGAPIGVVASSLAFVALPRTRADGYLGATTWAPTLRGGRVIRGVPATLEPSMRSGQDYVLVLEMHVRAPISQRWGVRDLIVHYRVGEATFTSRFAQRTSFPAASSCPVAL